MNLPATSSSEIEHVVRAGMERFHVPGVAIATTERGEVTWHGEYGLANVDRGSRVSAETVFHAASLSKPIYAYAAMKLVERGALDLDRPLASYGVPPFAPEDPLSVEVTARHVLSHTTGWPNWRPLGQSLLPRDAPPGERFGYSGEGLIYLSQSIEHITGMGLEAFMSEALLDPLGLDHTSYGWSSEEDDRVAASHDEDGAVRPRYVGSPEQAVTSLHTTAVDFARFTAVATVPGSLPWQLGADTLDEMLRPQVRVADGVSWGLGWGLASNSQGRTIWQWGDNPGYKNFAIADPDAQRGLVVLSNGEGGIRLWEPLVDLLFGGPHPAFTWLASTYYGSTLTG